MLLNPAAHCRAKIVKNPGPHAVLNMACSAIDWRGCRNRQTTYLSEKCMTYNFPIQLVNGPDELNNERMLLWPYCVSDCATNIRRSVETGTIKGRNARG